MHGLDYSYDYKERRTKVYVCEECGHSTGDPEEHFRHLQQNHPFCPALARCHDKRQFKFQTPDNVQNFQKVDPKPEEPESLVQTPEEQIVNVKSSEVIGLNHTTTDAQKNRSQTVVETSQIQHNIVRSENDLNKEIPSLSSNFLLKVNMNKNSLWRFSLCRNNVTAWRECIMLELLHV